MRLGIACWSGVACGAVFLAGCALEGDERREAFDFADDEIVNGEPDSGDPAVVALTVQGQVFCTATLITPSVVLTAAHCLPPHTGFATQQISVRFGDGVAAGGELIGAHDSWAHPAWNDNALYDDIGLLQMKSVAPVSPIARNAVPLGGGEPVRLVGFGVTSEMGTDSGVKRMGSATVESTDAFILELTPSPSSTCYGDSGGPTLSGTGATEVIAGVHSRGSCGFSSIEMRVDAYAADIDAFLDAHPDPTCEDDGLCAAACAAGPDPDCPCATDGYCTAACPDGRLDEDCGIACGPNGTCVESCSIPDPDCPRCEADGQCVESCPADPDCDACPDGECGGGNADDGDATVDQGCGCRVAPATGARGWLVLGLALTAAGRCRRRGSRRARPAAR
jgi:hypothetical protein